MGYLSAFSKTEELHSIHFFVRHLFLPFTFEAKRNCWQRQQELPFLRSWCSCLLLWSSALVRVSCSCWSFSWFWRCVMRSWARRSWISESRLFRSEEKRCSTTICLCSSWNKPGPNQTARLFPYLLQGKMLRKLLQYRFCTKALKLLSSCFTLMQNVNIM